LTRPEGTFAAAASRRRCIILFREQRDSAGDWTHPRWL
jgi:hypothetical protein